MANIARVRVYWAGTAVVGPAISTFYSTETTPNVGALYGFFDAIKARLPSSVECTIPNEGDLIESTTGRLSGAWVTSGGGQVNGTGVGSFARGTGARVVWNTGSVFGGRRVRGSTFLVPLVGSAFDSRGLLTPTVRTSFAQAADALLASTWGPNMVVFHRPRNFAGGNVALVTSATVPEAATQLRSRRV